MHSSPVAKHHQNEEETLFSEQNNSDRRPPRESPHVYTDRAMYTILWATGQIEIYTFSLCPLPFLSTCGTVSTPFGTVLESAPPTGYRRVRYGLTRSKSHRQPGTDLFQNPLYNHAEGVLQFLLFVRDRQRLYPPGSPYNPVMPAVASSARNSPGISQSSPKRKFVKRPVSSFFSFPKTIVTLHIRDINHPFPQRGNHSQWRPPCDSDCFGRNALSIFRFPKTF